MLSSQNIHTKLLILSDIHDRAIDAADLPGDSFDVVLHCGDFTNGSKICEYQTAIDLLQKLNAPLKLAIAGNHDFSLDGATLQQKVREAGLLAEGALVEREYGSPKIVSQMFKDAGIVLLDEGTHCFVLSNGAMLTTYASPYTPSDGDWGFQYHPSNGHNFDIRPGTDIVMTHGPPQGVMDRTTRGKRAGCPQLFAAVAKARPRVHCFGHIHEGWGAKLVKWKHAGIDVQPTHLTSIDNESSMPIKKLADIHQSRYDNEETKTEKLQALQKLAVNQAAITSHCADATHPLEPGTHTLFVNASIEAVHGESEQDHGLHQRPWLINIELPQQHSEDSSATR